MQGMASVAPRNSLMRLRSGGQSELNKSGSSKMLYGTLPIFPKFSEASEFPYFA